MTVKRSVSTSLARAFFSIVLLSLLSTGIAMLTLASSLKDAEAVNIAGSLRMQSYRLGYDLQSDSKATAAHLQHYRQSLNASTLQQLNRFWVPAEVKARYHALQHAWAQMQQHIVNEDIDWYRNNIAAYVAQIDLFVLALQHYAERKMLQVVAASVVGFIAIFTLVFFTLRRIRQQVVMPLNTMVEASKAIERGEFTIPNLDRSLPNELGALAQAFIRMANELQKLYRSLEQQVEQKTLRLQEANRMLEVLYSCSQALNVSTINRDCFAQILRIIHQHEAVSALEMQVGENWCLTEGTPVAEKPWYALPLVQQDSAFGTLRWQPSDKASSPQLMRSVATMLGRGVYFNQAQKHYQQLLLMEERATIARELHDSLAQVLSYLRIQLALLKRAVPEENHPAQRIVRDFAQALNDAYRQLRELLTTFRLTLQQADLPAALQELLAPLREQTLAEISLTCSLPTQLLDASQQIHLLQIIREAVLNAIKHANASHIEVVCRSESGGHYVSIVDNGHGMASFEEPEGHYGLNIMHERAGRLGGQLIISRPPEGGTRVEVHFTSAPPAAAGNPNNH